MGTIEFLLTQTGLIDIVLVGTSMADCNRCTTPATTEPLHTDKHGRPNDKNWQFDSIIGMLINLASNTHPDIAYTIHQTA